MQLFFPWKLEQIFFRTLYSGICQVYDTVGFQSSFSLLLLMPDAWVNWCLSGGWSRWCQIFWGSCFCTEYRILGKKKSLMLVVFCPSISAWYISCSRYTHICMQHTHVHTIHTYIHMHTCVYMLMHANQDTVLFCLQKEIGFLLFLVWNIFCKLVNFKYVCNLKYTVLPWPW